METAIIVIIEMIAVIAYMHRTIGPGSKVMRDHRLRERDDTDLRTLHRFP